MSADPDAAQSSIRSGVDAIEAAARLLTRVVAPGGERTQQQAARHANASMALICSTVESAASANELPLPFFARLIWQESRFKTDAVSPAGARGIAQFMPGTAQWRGLEDPLDPFHSLLKSADYLRELRNQFGNLGLAAAAYNGGSGRVQAWLDGRGGMPRETRDYVRIITGLPIEIWRARAEATAVPAGRIPLKVPCPAMVAAAVTSDPDPAQAPLVAVAASSPEPRVLLRATTPQMARAGGRAKQGRHQRITRVASVAKKWAMKKWAGKKSAVKKVRARRTVARADTIHIGGHRPVMRGRTAMSELKVATARR